MMNLDQLAARIARLRLAGDTSGARELLDSAPAEAAIYPVVALERANLAIREGAWRRAIETIDEVWRDAIEPEVRAKLKERKAWAFFRLGDFDGAKRTAEEILRDFALPQSILGAAANTLGGVAWHRGYLEQAIRHTAQAIGLFEQANDPVGAANAHANLSVLLYARGQWSAARHELEQCDAIRSLNGIAAGRSTTLYNLGVIEFSLGQYDDARRHFEESLQIGHTTGEAYEPLRANMALAHIDILENRWDEAGRRLDDALAHDELINEDDRIQAVCLIAILECARGDLSRAEAFAVQARARAYEASLVDSEIDCCLALAGALRRAGRLADADELLAEAQVTAESLGDPYRRGMICLERGAIAKQTGRSDYRRYADQAISLFGALGAKRHLDRALELLA